jgi:hypothetical protein
MLSTRAFLGFDASKPVPVEDLWAWRKAAGRLAKAAPRSPGGAGPEVRGPALTWWQLHGLFASSVAGMPRDKRPRGWSKLFGMHAPCRPEDDEPVWAGPETLEVEHAGDEHSVIVYLEPMLAVDEFPFLGRRSWCLRVPRDMHIRAFLALLQPLHDAPAQAVELTTFRLPRRLPLSECDESVGLLWECWPCGRDETWDLEWSRHALPGELLSCIFLAFPFF